MLHSAADAARQLNCDEATVRRACAKHGIGQLVARSWVLTDSEVVQLRAIVRSAPGNPNFVAGNYFGKPPKPPKKTRKK